jgi:hypothetical protein
MCRVQVVQRPVYEDWQVQQGLEKTQSVTKVASMVGQPLLGRKRHSGVVILDFFGLSSIS